MTLRSLLPLTVGYWHTNEGFGLQQGFGLDFDVEWKILESLGFK